MFPLEVVPQPQCPTCRGQMCSKEVRCVLCANWISIQWYAYESRRNTYTHKVEGLSLSRGSSASVLQIVQVEVHWKQVPNVLCPLGPDSSIHPPPPPPRDPFAAICHTCPGVFSGGSFHRPDIPSCCFGYYVNSSVDESHGIPIQFGIISALSLMVCYTPVVATVALINNANQGYPLTT